MTEYTPSDGEVRMIYHRGMKTQRPYVSPADAHSEFDRFLARVRRDAWQEGYEQGAEDGITSEQMQVGIGLGGIARPARTNPYETEDQP